MIRKEAWSFYRTIFGVRLCWELEEPKGPNKQTRVGWRTNDFIWRGNLSKETLDECAVVGRDLYDYQNGCDVCTPTEAL